MQIQVAAQVSLLAFYIPGASAQSAGLRVPASMMQAALGDSTVPEPAPGLRIPNGNLPWALDTFQGNKQLVPVHASATQLNNHKGSNIAGGLAAGPFYKSKMTTELNGTTARTALHTSTPTFFLHLGDAASEAEGGQSMIAGWAIVHAGVDKDRRLLSTVKFTQPTGNAKRSDGQVEATVETHPNGWMKISPVAPLTAGEYALLPVMRQANAFSTSVYDFRIDPTAEKAKDAVSPSSQE